MADQKKQRPREGPEDIAPVAAIDPDSLMLVEDFLGQTPQALSAWYQANGTSVHKGVRKAIVSGFHEMRKEYKRKPGMQPSWKWQIANKMFHVSRWTRLMDLEINGPYLRGPEPRLQLQHLPWLKHLQVCDWHDPTLTVANMFVPCPTHQHLTHVLIYAQVEANELILALPPTVTNLHVVHCTTTAPLELRQLPHLQQLMVAQMAWETQQAPLKLASCGPALEVACFECFAYDSVLPLPVSLRTLSLQASCITDSLELHAFPHLTELVLSSHTQASCPLVGSPPPALHTVSFERSSSWRQSVAALPRTVTSLTLINCTHDGFLDLNGFPELTELELRHDEDEGPPLLTKLVLPLLRTVQIISDWAHTLVGQLPPGVTSLYLHTPGGGFPGVLPLALDGVLPQLESLEVAASEIEDCNLTHLPRTLRRISVEAYWYEITDVALQLAKSGAHTTFDLWGLVFEVTPATDELDVVTWLDTSGVRGSCE